MTLVNQALQTAVPPQAMVLSDHKLSTIRPSVWISINEECPDTAGNGTGNSAANYSAPGCCVFEQGLSEILLTKHPLVLFVRIKVLTLCSGQIPTQVILFCLPNSPEQCPLDRMFFLLPVLNCCIIMLGSYEMAVKFHPRDSCISVAGK